LAGGDLNIKKIAFSDAEVDYSCGSGTTYTLASNEVLSRAYRRNGVITMNYDGTPPFDLPTNSVFGTTETIAEPVESIGFYTNVTDSTNLADYRVDTSLCLATGYTETSFGPVAWFGASPNFARFYLSGATNHPPEEGLVFVRFIVPGGGVPTDNVGENIGYYANFYRYRYTSGTSLVEVDRTIPRYDFNPSPKKDQPLFFYPLSGYSAYYGSGTTTPCPIWNMNIITKTVPIGYEENAFTVISLSNGNLSVPSDVVTTTFGSRNISGLVRSFGLDGLPKCGIIHYSNSYSGNLYGDQFIPRETEIDIPHILWHRNGTGANGTSMRGGLKLVDYGSDILYDVSGRTNYTLLRDGVGPNSLIVGRVYYDMKLIMITDQELLTALDAKSSRNWTCPPLSLELVSVTDNPIIQAGGYTGIAQSGKRYYVTYHMVSLPTLGPRQSLPCAYVQVIDGKEDDDGNPMFIKATLPPNSFPFLRTSQNAYSGAAYHSNCIQMLIQEVDIDDDTGILGLNQAEWKVANLDGSGDYGISRFGNIGVLPVISPTEINNTVFYATREEYDDGEFFRMPTHANGGNIGQNLGLDYPFWYGDLEFFYGNITTKRLRKNYIRNVRFFLDKDVLNTTLNSSYSSGSTFITEIFLLSDDNRVLGVAKPDRPLEKNDITLIDMTLKSYY